jgi:hypothetical protein
MIKRTLDDDATLADVAGHLNAPAEYVRRVLENMWECKREFGAASVRIGVMGEGRAPNYRIEYLSEWSGPSIFAVYNGLGHTKIEDLGEINLDDFFNEDNSATPTKAVPDRLVHYDHWSSGAITLDEVQTLLGQLRQAKRR